MNRVEFMGQLERLLWDIPESDRLDALRYYNDYFDEAGPENEAQVIQKLGSPGKVAATIKADLNLAGNQHAEYTERGYYDGRENTNPNPPAQKEKGYHEPKQKRQIPLAMSEKFTTLQAEVCSYRIAATIPCCMPTTISRAL